MTTRSTRSASTASAASSARSAPASSMRRSLGGPGRRRLSAWARQLVTQIQAVARDDRLVRRRHRDRDLHRQGAHRPAGHAPKSNRRARPRRAWRARLQLLINETGHPPPHSSSFNEAAGSYRGSSCERLAGACPRPFFSCGQDGHGPGCESSRPPFLPGICAPFCAQKIGSVGAKLGLSNMTLIWHSLRQEFQEGRA